MKINTPENIVELIIVFAISSISLIFWDSFFTYPIKIIVVLLHEICHAIMAILTGGQVISITFNYNLSGVTITNGGNQIMIAASGYLGSLTIGSLLFLSSKNQKLRKWFTIILSLTILIVAVNSIIGGFQVFISLIIASIFFFVPKYLGESINRYFFKILGLICCFYVIADIKQDLLTTTLRETDTQILEYLTGIPALLIGGVWFLLSLFVVYLLIKKITKFN